MVTKPAVDHRELLLIAGLHPFGHGVNDSDPIGHHIIRMGLEPPHSVGSHNLKAIEVLLVRVS